MAAERSIPVSVMDGDAHRVITMNVRETVAFEMPDSATSAFSRLVGEMWNRACVRAEAARADRAFTPKEFREAFIAELADVVRTENEQRDVSAEVPVRHDTWADVVATVNRYRGRTFYVLHTWAGWDKIVAFIADLLPVPHLAALNCSCGEPAVDLNPGSGQPTCRACRDRLMLYLITRAAATDELLADVRRVVDRLAVGAVSMTGGQADLVRDVVSTLLAVVAKNV